MAIRAFKFTKATIERLPLPLDGRAEYADTEIAALRLRVTARGTKTFSALLWVPRQRRLERVTIGKFPSVSVDVARATVRQDQGKVATGNNPAEERRRAHEQATFGEASDSYFADRAAAGVRRLADMRASWERYLGPLPVEERKPHAVQRAKPQGSVDWSKRKLSEITHERTKQLYRAIVATGKTTTANRVHELLRAIMNHAGVSPNPAEGIARIPEKKRKRFLSKEELARFIGAVDSAPQPWRDFFTVLLFVGYRRSAVAAMRWADVDLQRQTWTVPDASAKNNEPIALSLAGAAIEAIQRRASERAKTKPSSQWVFPGHGADGHITRPKGAWARVLKQADLTGVTPHDLRRTLGSWMAIEGVSLLAIARVLGHRDSRSANVYAYLNDAAARAAVERAHGAFTDATKATR